MNGGPDERVGGWLGNNAAPDCSGAALFGVSDGTRTRDIRDHNAALYQLSYTHHCSGPHDRERLSWISLPVEVSGSCGG